MKILGSTSALPRRIVNPKLRVPLRSELASNSYASNTNSKNQVSN